MILLIIGMNFLPLCPLPILIALFSNCCWVSLPNRYAAPNISLCLSITSCNPFKLSYLGRGIDVISWMAFLLAFFTLSFVIPCYNCLQYIKLCSRLRTRILPCWRQRPTQTSASTQQYAILMSQFYLQPSFFVFWRGHCAPLWYHTLLWSLLAMPVIDIDGSYEGSWEEVPAGLFLFFSCLVDYHTIKFFPDEYPFSPF